MTLSELIRKLPVSLQNKIFYYATLHPMARAFKEEYNYFEKYITNDDYKMCKIRFQYFSKLYRNYESDTSLYFPFNTWSKNDMKPFIIINKIIKEKREVIYEIYSNLYNESKLCIKCEHNIILNNIDKYCSVCIKEIKLEYASIPKFEK